ncbi:hypothetical protein EIN_409130 [Entamoeba invadens IP1]|uniref:non-specific serine/threonine protein kinase n=1 Tax=Entamoeba invadens IP1 TaxID=370355 RepID=A0A0A1TWM1_ENTIV|nr:hypothetical protein EIN_409130 [Entamoeba invadens IP1]ELP85624.1 hypothetical protein EIN_409130 [Entamoeba invadens IP1]|eukprot:XP_004184970.1 hypothetical protein EIN_409130 [Entamoeba invadens IP1]
MDFGMAHDEFAEYELVQRVGQGSFGSVYKAFEKTTQTFVAIKCLSAVGNQETMREIDILKLLKCDYIIKYYTSLRRQEEIWIVMEFCFYGSVADMIDILGLELPEDVIAQICHDALNGLIYLHQHHKIHRDIKPANFLISQNGTVKLADFGIATTLDAKSHHKTLIGTPYFLAPEIVDESGYNEKVDVWALGISVIEMAELYPPYYNIYPMKVLMLIHKNPPPKLKNENEHSLLMREFLSLCLVKDPDQRARATTLLQHPFITMKNKQSLVVLLDRLSEKIQENGGIEKALELIKMRKKEMTAQKPDVQDQRQDQSLKDEMDELDDIIKGFAMADVQEDDDVDNNETLLQQEPEKSLADADVKSLVQNMITSPSKPEDMPIHKVPTRFSPVPLANFPWHSEKEIGDENMIEHEQQDSLNIPKVFAVESERTAEERNMPSPISSFSNENPNQPFVPLRREYQNLDSKVLLVKSNAEITRKTIDNGDNEIVRFSSEWKGVSAGGCHAFPTWRNNLQISLQIRVKTQVRISLEQIAEESNLTHIGLYLLNAEESKDRKRILELDDESASGKGVTFSAKRRIEQTVELDVGWYVVFGCTYQPNIRRKFNLEFEYLYASCIVKALNEIDTDWKMYQINGEWTYHTNGGRVKNSSYQWCDNPKFLMTVIHPTPMFIVLTANVDKDEDEVGFVMFEKNAYEMPLSVLMPGNVKEESDLNEDGSASLMLEHEIETHILLPYLQGKSARASFQIYVYSMWEIYMSAFFPTKTVWAQGAWNSETAGGSFTYSDWWKNQQFYLRIGDSTRIVVELIEKGNSDDKISKGMTMIRVNKDEKVFNFENKQIVFSTDFTYTGSITKTINVEHGEYIIIPMTLFPGDFGSFTIVVHELFVYSFESPSIELKEANTSQLPN